MNEDRIAGIVQSSLCHSHLEQAKVLKERATNRARYLGEQNVALLWAMVMAHEAAAQALLEAAKESLEAGRA